jgi:hypothetical protein
MKVSILCSGFGLGFYIPGLLINYQLKQTFIPTEVLVFETLFQTDKKDKIDESKKAYHNNFSVALMAQKMPKDIRTGLDEMLVEQLLQLWEKEDRRHFIAISGHWIYILDRYRERQYPKPIYVDLLYVDSGLSPSWKSLKKFNPGYDAPYQEVWLYDWQNRSVNQYISVSRDKPIRFDEREDRYVIHGGGWGMGTYREKISELEQFGLSLDVVIYEPEEAQHLHHGNRYYMNAPNWRSWEREANGRHEFPLFAEIKGGDSEPTFSNIEEHHKLYSVVRRSKAIISKPGAGTVMESFASATPVILLEPFGDHEQKNADIWLSLGFGISYADWKESNYSSDLLQALHNNLLSKLAETRNYVDDYVIQYHNTNVRGEKDVSDRS